MTRFVRSDVSQKITAICIVDNACRRLWRGQCPTVPDTNDYPAGLQGTRRPDCLRRLMSEPNFSGATFRPIVR